MRVSLMLMALLSCQLVFGHGDVHVQIDSVTEQIQAAPENSDLRLKRAKLYMADGDQAKAEADLNAALEIDKNRAAHYEKAKLYLGQKKFDKAITEAQTFIARLDDEAGALMRGYTLLGRAYFARQDWKNAELAYQRALENADKPRVVLYMKLANTQQQMGKNESALQTLRDGLDALGNVAVVQNAYLNQLIACEKYPEALTFLNEEISNNQQLIERYTQKGDVLILLNRPALATEAWQAALIEIDKLPSHRRNTQAIQNAAADLQSKIDTHSEPPAI